MDRKKELMKIVADSGKEKKDLLLPLINHVVEMEKQLDAISKLPFYKVNPANNTQQKMLPAFKIYKELLQQYNNVIKTIAGAIGQSESEEESPLRKWVKGRVKEGD